MIDFAALQDYLDGPFTEIAGWCNPGIWQAIQPLAEAMAEHGDVGPVAEIGVHQGRFFIGLVKTLGQTGERRRGNHAIDVFDLQAFNLDGSGKGNLEAFNGNLDICGVDSADVKILRADSLTLTRPITSRILSETGGFSFFSVDGCHMAEHTINDMEIAFELTRPDGIIFIDDYYNAYWPGVQEGVTKYYLTNSPRFVPLLFACNKLFLCSLSWHRIYLKAVWDFIKEHHPNTRMKKVSRFGYDTLTIAPPPESKTHIISRTAEAA